MKNFAKQTILILAVLPMLFLFIACQNDTEIKPKAESLEYETTVNHVGLDADESHALDDIGIGYEDEIINHLEGHQSELDMVEEIDFLFPDGTSEKRLLVGGDVVMTEAELRDLKTQIESGARQYRTSNLVSSPQTISVLGYTGGSFALTSKMRTALSWAVANYNALPLNLNFTLSYGTNLSSADIVVYRNYTNSGAGGSAGFPSGGQPYKWVQIYAGMENYNTNVNEHVIGHEIGHCLGLRHTDYFSRASCGQNTNEGSAGVGAIHIPGTPTGIDWNSLMLACFSSSEDGEFGFYDRVALEYLY